MTATIVPGEVSLNFQFSMVVTHSLSQRLRAIIESVGGRVYEPSDYVDVDACDAGPFVLIAFRDGAARLDPRYEVPGLSSAHTIE
jgi:hypothetical protein